MFCGVPGQGIHSTRIFGFAFWDIFITVVAAFLLDKWLLKGKSFWGMFLALIIVAVVVHKSLGINTKLNSILFSS